MRVAKTYTMVKRSFSYKIIHDRSRGPRVIKREPLKFSAEVCSTSITKRVFSIQERSFSMKRSRYRLRRLAGVPIHQCSIEGDAISLNNMRECAWYI